MGCGTGPSFPSIHYPACFLQGHVDTERPGCLSSALISCELTPPKAPQGRVTQISHYSAQMVEPTAACCTEEGRQGSTQKECGLLVAAQELHMPSPVQNQGCHTAPPMPVWAKACSSSTLQTERADPARGAAISQAILPLSTSLRPCNRPRTDKAHKAWGDSIQNQPYCCGDTLGTTGRLDTRESRCPIPLKPQYAYTAGCLSAGPAPTGLCKNPPPKEGCPPLRGDPSMLSALDDCVSAGARRRLK